MGIFAAALGISRGVKGVSDYYLQEQQRKEDEARQLAMQNRQLAVELNDPTSLEAANQVLGTSTPGMAQRLGERHQASEKEGRLRQESMQTSIDATRHGMSLADQERTDRLSQFEKTYGLQAKQLQASIDQWHAQLAQGDRHHADQMRMEGARLGQSASQHADSMSLQRAELALRKQGLDTPGVGYNLQHINVVDPNTNQPMVGIFDPRHNAWWDDTTQKWRTDIHYKPYNNDPYAALLQGGAAPGAPGGTTPASASSPEPSSGGIDFGGFLKRPQAPAPMPVAPSANVAPTPAPLNSTAPAKPGAGMSYYQKKKGGQ